MKFGIYIVFAAFMALSVASYGQDSGVHRPPPRRYTPLPLPPRFPGGRDSLALYIKSHTRYPRKAKKHHIKGVIEVDFLVDTAGHLKNIRVLKPLGYGCDKEALRVVKGMPQWIPGMLGRKPMEMDFHVDIPFGTDEH